MSLAYGLTALISLIMVGLCVIVDKKRDIWLILVFISVSMCNLGYFMVSVSQTLSSALNSNRISYLGSVFLPFFVLMMVLRFCNIKRSKWLMESLVVLGIVMLGITTSPGILPIYYKSVDIATVNGATRLIREYGPFHTLYYVYLFGYMFSMVGVAFYAIGKKKIKTKYHTVLLLFTVFCNIVIWLVEQLLPRGFEWLSVSYILTECFILVIYRSMQKQGLMNEKEKPKSYTVNLLLVIFLLLFANFIRVITKATEPSMYVASHIVVLMIYLGILVAWSLSVYDRIINKNIRRYLILLVGLMMLWMLMRTLRFTVFNHVFPVGQWCWYAYYIAMVLIPQMSLFAAKHIGKPEEYRLPNKWRFMYIPSFLLIIGIMTNDLHQLAFRFHMGYEQGWDFYERSVLYYLAVLWIFSCIALMIAEIITRCRVPGARKVIWMPIAMVGIGVLYTVLYAFDSDLFGFIEVTAALCFTVVGIWESSIKTGLVQSNAHYSELLKYSGLGVAVTDSEFVVHYSSEDALPLTREQMSAARREPLLLDSGTRVSVAEIRGGYTVWQEDLSELIEVLEELSELREELKGSNEVFMQNYKINKQIRALAEQNRIHDRLHKEAAHQIDLLGEWLGRLRVTDDAAEKKELLCRIVVVGAYFKRRSNLILVNEQEGMIKKEELELSINEMMKSLQLAGVSCACSVQLEQDIPAGVMMRLFDFYEFVVENTFGSLNALLARFFYRDGGFYACVDAVCDTDLTELGSDTVSVSVTDEGSYTLSLFVKEEVRG